MSHFVENRKKEFPNVLRELMRSWSAANNQRLTQEQLGNAIYVRRETISAWLNGKQYPFPDTLARLADFFKVPVRYFDKDNGLTMIDEETHSVLERQCEEAAQEMNLSPAFVSFVKTIPGLSDSIASLCWLNPSVQSLDPSVPELPGNVFQFVASSGVKVYLTNEVMLMLSLVQQDVTEAMQYFVQKHSKVISDYYKSDGKRIEPNNRYWLEKRGMSGLSDAEAALIEVYRKNPKAFKAQKGKKE